MSERESWMPTNEEIRDVLLEDDFIVTHQLVAALIRRAAAKRALACLEEIHASCVPVVTMLRVVSELTAELSPITAAPLAAEEPGK